MHKKLIDDPKLLEKCKGKPNKILLHRKIYQYNRKRRRRSVSRRHNVKTYLERLLKT